MAASRCLVSLAFRAAKNPYYPPSVSQVFIRDFVRLSIPRTPINTRVSAVSHSSPKCSTHCSTHVFRFSGYFRGIFDDILASSRLIVSDISLFSSRLIVCIISKCGRLLTPSLSLDSPTVYRPIRLIVVVSSSRLTGGMPPCELLKGFDEDVFLTYR